MIASFLTHEQWSPILRLGPRNLLKVTPVTELLQTGFQIQKNSRDPSLIKSTFDELDHLLTGRGVRIDPEKKRLRAVLTREVAQKIVETYFVQLLHSKQWILDFSASAWRLQTRSSRGDSLTWQPSALIHVPTPGFSHSIAQLYDGFYVGDEERFRTALRNLNLVGSESLLSNHFGVGKQRSVRFSLSDLQGTFFKVFENCARDGIRLSPEFGALGFALLGLYQTLEPTGLTLDVRGAYEAARVTRDHP